MKGGGDNTKSVWLQLDKLYCVKVGDLAGMPADTWEWVDYQNGNTAEKIPTPLIGTGHHIIKLIGNASEPGVAVDRILMMIDISCVPTGNGDACIDVVNTPTPTAVPPTSTPTPIPTPVPPTPCSQTTGLGGTRLTCRIVGIPTKKGAYFPVFTAIDAIGHKTSKKIKLQVE
jgi:hypothetical protein